MKTSQKETINSLYRMFGRVGITITLLVLISYVYPRIISETPNDNTWIIVIILTAIGLFKLSFPTIFTIRYET